MARAEEITPELLHAPVRELAELLRTRRLTSVALTKAYLERLEKIGPKLNAVVTVAGERALKEAGEADKEIAAGRYRGPLHGIPYGAKDILATKGIPTTWGAEPYKDQVFDHDATVVRRLQEAGAVLAAKLAMVELAGGFGYNNADASFTGPCRTPWNLAYWSGGSSAGSAAATAAGLVAFAVGSETSGSIIVPAAFCGVSGLRPTYGRVSRHGAMALSWSLDKLGPLCRSADDCGLVLAALAGRDPLDPTTAAKPFAWAEPPKAGGKKFKVGVFRGAAEGAQPEVRKNFEAAVKVLGEIAEVTPEVSLPDLPYSDAVGTILKAEGASAFRELIESGRCQKLRAVKDRWGGYAGLMMFAVDYLQAQRVRTVVRRRLDELYAQYDALVAPSLSTVAYPIDRDFDQAYPGFGAGALPALIPAGNLAGQPALSIPDGFGAKDLPTGIQFTGRAWGEARLLALAHAYQQATDWHRKRPPEPKLEGASPPFRKGVSNRPASRHYRGREASPIRGVVREGRACAPADVTC
jgi:aspartyl-tRNA(Asn)/glutamyl-tRNA(Gln) amidotransferase subunit A